MPKSNRPRRRRDNPIPGVSITDLWARDDRAHGMRWWFRVIIPLTVPRQRISRAYPDDMKTAGLAWAREVVRRAWSGEVIAPQPVPFSTVADGYLTTLRADTRARSKRHMDELTAILGAAGPAIGDLRDPKALTRAQRWLAERCEGMSPSTRMRYAGHLRAAAAWATSAGMVQRDPLQLLRTDSPQCPPPVTFTLDELKLLVSDRAMTDDFGRLVAVLAWTGLRLREGMWLRWSDLDPETGTVAIDAPDDDERAAGATLKRNRTRFALLPAEMWEAMQTWPRDSAPYLFGPGLRRINGTVQIRRHLANLGIPVAGRHIHSLRHSYCALALASGLDSMRLQHAVGHASSAMTAHYSQAANRTYREARSWAGELHLRAPPAAHQREA